MNKQVHGIRDGRDVAASQMPQGRHSLTLAALAASLAAFSAAFWAFFSALASSPCNQRSFLRD